MKSSFWNGRRGEYDVASLIEVSIVHIGRNTHGEIVAYLIGNGRREVYGEELSIVDEGA